MAAKKKKKKNNNQVVVLALSAVFFVIVLISTVFADWVQINENKKQTSELTVEYENLLEEEASLNSEVVKLQDPAYLARYAREKYMYTKDGEVILKIIDSNSVSAPKIDENVQDNKGEE